MTIDDTEIVSALQLALVDKVGQQRFDLWFGGSTRLSLEDGALKVIVPNKFLQEWLRANFRQHLESVCNDLLGAPTCVRFEVQTAGDPGGLQHANGESPPGTNQPSEAVLPLCPVHALESPPAAKRRAYAELDSFVVGPSNRLAYAAAQDVAGRPGRVSPLVLFGSTSIGKTHLLEGIWSAARRAHPHCQAVLLSAEQFTSLFLGALHGGGLPSFRRKYRGLDLLIVDDIQFFAGKRATLVELLHTIDAFLREGRQLVFASDRHPVELKELSPELATRLQGGLVCGLEVPEYETRLAIVRQLAARRELVLSDDVFEFIASNLHSHARELCGALNRLETTSQALGRPITVQLAREALTEAVRRNARDIRLADITRVVGEVIGLDPTTLESEGKSRDVIGARALCMWLARKHTRAALSEISRHFGRRSHSTVLSAQKKVAGWMASSAQVSLAGGTWHIEDAIRRIEDALRAG